MTPETSTKLTYEDFLLLPEDGRRHEIIDGEHYVTPSPATKHQAISFNLTLALGNYTRASRLGRIFAAPYDVVLSASDIVEPDLVFVKFDRAHIIAEAHIEGAPDLVIEILSPGTRKRDETIKRKLYERAGVFEYWLVDPESERITIYRNDGARFARVEVGAVITSLVLPGFELALADVFAME
ncbi:MAG TPA: Uma2 family endonuclease [Thermoanaerobaculia bacterium]|nr:Uma2 family endonuclease [Thermoanaerobaculia bacterium]